MKLLPRVDLFYAVKCCPLMPVVRLLAALGIGFDCASQNEIELVLSIGVDPSKIIYALPCKPATHLQLARKRNVALMTFDNEDELHKVKKYYPDARLVIRLRADETGAKLKMGNKFGCSMKRVDELLTVAKELDLNVVGVSFFAGDDTDNSVSFLRNLDNCRKTFDIAASLGYDMKLLDIGGGFTGEDTKIEIFYKMATDIRNYLDEYFPPESGIDIIAEPGRYFVDSAFSLATNIIGKNRTEGKMYAMLQKMFLNYCFADSCSYYVNESIYLSFWKNCIQNGNYIPKILKKCRSEKLDQQVMIYGTTCDGIDILTSNATLPELSLEDWIIWDDMGAYTVLYKFGFNGVTTTKAFYFVNKEAWKRIQDSCQNTKFLPSEVDSSASVPVQEVL
uniref:ornithine decarboxylase n=1 Tax=Ciona savignyi TaxID=51511 RepID=H2Z7A5_CIOSA